MNREIPPVVASSSRPAARANVGSTSLSAAPAVLPVAPVSLSAVSAALSVASLSFQRDELIERMEERINRLEAMTTEPFRFISQRNRRHGRNPALVVSHDFAKYPIDIYLPVCFLS
ncbi:hypothetical protein A0J61_11973 [Choanephora cucurbitarum]|uniref:Uncharacterized protein n=1 Tax=Choanephora cucurbitarum TaxID=101091 RepID=A0A1C7LJG5_9FUNG|nr:hypothetical protein A0J61_11973 [Choanephora cucurbitarum]